MCTKRVNLSSNWREQRGIFLPSKWASEKTNWKSQIVSDVWIVATHLEGTLD